jgi:hypothetical protein
MKNILGSREQIEFYWRKFLHGADLDTKVSTEEFLYFVENPREISSKEEALWWFESFDSDKNGYMSKAEVKELAKYIEWLPEELPADDLFKILNISGADVVNKEDFIKCFEKQSMLNKQKESAINSKMGTTSSGNASVHQKMVFMLSNENDVNSTKLIERWTVERDVKALKKILENIKTLPIGWTKIFLASQGFEVITEALASSNINLINRSKYDIVLQNLCVEIIYALLQTQTGIQAFLKDPRCLYLLAQILIEKNPSTGKIALVFATIISVDNSGFEFIMKAFDYLHLISHSKLKFETLINLFESSKDQNASTNLVLLMNEILVAAPNDKMTFQIQQNFINLGLIDIVNVCMFRFKILEKSCSFKIEIFRQSIRNFERIIGN